MESNENLVAIKEQVADALAMLRAPGFDNNGGPANIADEVRTLLDNNNAYAREAARAAAVYNLAITLAKIVTSPYQDKIEMNRIGSRLLKEAAKFKTPESS